MRVLLFAYLLFSCGVSKNIDIDKEKKMILELHAKQRENHFKKDAKAMSENPTDSFMVVDGGGVFRPKRTEQSERFEKYFNSVDFIKWDDIKPPVIRFSNDASVAYVAVEKLVVLKGIGSSGKEVIDTTYFSWMSVYKKEKSGWKLDAIASTRKQK